MNIDLTSLLGIKFKRLPFSCYSCISWFINITVKCSTKSVLVQSFLSLILPPHAITLVLIHIYK